MKPKKLIQLAAERKCVTGFHASGAIVQRHHMPAAFLVSMPFRLVMSVTPRLKLYKPKTTR